MGTGSVFVTTPGGGKPGVMKDGLVFHVPFDNNFTDIVNNKNPSVNTGTISANGKIKQAGNYPAASSQSVYDPILIGTHVLDITVSAWVSVGTLHTSFNGFLAVRTGSSSTINWVLALSAKKPCVYIGATSYTFGDQLDLNVYNHLAFTYKKSTTTLKCYQNGQLKLTQTNAPVPVTVAADGLMVGQINLNGVYSALGLIDDVRIYEKIKTDDEIQKIYQYKGI